MATAGSAVVDFGAFPGATEASVAITGQAAIIATSLVEAWVSANQTSPASDHNSDDIVIDPVTCYAGDIVPGTGFTIYLGTTDQHLRYNKYNVDWVWQ